MSYGRDSRLGRCFISAAFLALSMLFFVLLIGPAGAARLENGVSSANAPHPERILNAGVSHTCALTPGSKADCWGNNDYGQIENNIYRFSQISAGQSHTCGLKPDGSVDCWGAPAYVVDQNPREPFTQIGVGTYFACGLKSTGWVDCWGYNAQDRSGVFTQISVGPSHTCALKENGAVECWSSVSGFQLENQDGPYTQISTGTSHACGLKANGRVECWGKNDDGQAENRQGPFTQISAGGSHNCGLKQDGSIICWGLNDDGQAENKTGPYLQVTAGSLHTCALKQDRSIDCWGNNQNGRAEDQQGPFGSSSQTASQITRVSTDAAGEQGNDDSWDPAISPDGRFVVFVSNAYNLWGGERYEHSLRIKDLLTGKYVGGIHGYQDDDLFKHPTISRDGHFVAYEYFSVDGYGPQGITLYDLQQRKLLKITQSEEYNPAISDDGQFVVFEADTPDLVSVDDNGKRDIFIYSHAERKIDMISAVVSNGSLTPGNGDSYGPSMSADGRYVAFRTEATNLTSEQCPGDWFCEYILVHDRQTGQTTRAEKGSEYEDVFLHDPVISADGQYVAYGYDCADWAPEDCASRIVVKKWQTGQEWSAGIEDNHLLAYNLSISADGSFVAFYSASNIYLYDRQKGKIRLISADIDGIPGNDRSGAPAISADGQYIAFESAASNLVDNDTNSSKDVFVYDRLLVDNPLADPEQIISAGEYHTCALQPNGRADCWGAEQEQNDHGQARDQAGPFIQVGTGAIHSCGLRTDGSVDCWGTTAWYGQGEDRDGTFTQISVGGNHNCGLKPDGSVECWGGNWKGQADAQTGPFVQIGAGWDHSCGLGPDGTIDCWGSNDLGQTEEVIGPFKQVSVGSGHTCALRLTGSVDCWGRNEDGQAEDQIGPYSQVSAGGRHTCGLKPDGSVHCWGFNSDGQAEDQKGPFIQISAGGTWMLGADGWGHTCGLKPNGSVECWGGNEDGQAENQRGPYGLFSPSILLPVILR